MVALWGELASACRRSVFVRARPLDGRRVARSPAALGAVAVKPVVAAVGAGSAGCEEELLAAAGPVSRAGAAGAGADPVSTAAVGLSEIIGFLKKSSILFYW